MNGTSMTHERERERDDRLSKPHSSEVKRRSDIMINVLLFRREREKKVFPEVPTITQSTALSGALIGNSHRYDDTTAAEKV